jgi:hypothetical protein
MTGFWPVSFAYPEKFYGCNEDDSLTFDSLFPCEEKPNFAG